MTKQEITKIKGQIVLAPQMLSSPYFIISECGKVVTNGKRTNKSKDER